jgi:hypothetical protein
VVLEGFICIPVILGSVVSISLLRPKGKNSGDLSRTLCGSIDGRPWFGVLLFRYSGFLFAVSVRDGLLVSPTARMATALYISAAPRTPAYGYHDLCDRNLMDHIRSVFLVRIGSDFKCYVVQAHRDSHGPMGSRRGAFPRAYPNHVIFL